MRDRFAESPDLSEEEKAECARAYYSDVARQKAYDKKIEDEVKSIPWPIEGEE